MASPPTIDALLLEVLAAGPHHGYAAIVAIRERSGGVLDFPEGTVYPALHRLEREGNVCSTTELIAGRRRRVYEVTGAGREARAAHRRAWRAYAEGIEALLGSATTGATTGATA
jgi:DNA-binding PadR family transcriptional regulator